MGSPTPARRPPTAERPVVRRARALAFVLGLAWIFGPPFYRQVLRGRDRHAHMWAMFNGVGLELVDARFYEQLPDGTRRELDRWAALERERPERVRDRRLRGRKATWKAARELCRALGSDADVRAVARRATRNGWVWDEDGDTNLCTAPAPLDPREANPRDANEEPDE